ncbi:MAG: hypothetical protein K2I74_02195 [Treponemataceae bacterium]|nr:hypothetical protein [Treponemataceae bacterium]
MKRTLQLADFNQDQMHDEIIHEIDIENGCLVLHFNELHFPHGGTFSKAKIVFSGFEDILYDVRFNFFAWNKRLHIKHGTKRYLYEMLEELGKKKKTFEVINTYFAYKTVLIFGECKDNSTGKTEEFVLEIDADEISYMFFE